MEIKEFFSSPSSPRSARSSRRFTPHQLRDRGPLFSSLEELRDKLNELLGNYNDDHLNLLIS